MVLGFSGEVAAFYARFRRGYPPVVIDSLVAALGLTADDAVLDLGCGTGQLSVPVGRRVRAIVGMDPEPDMLTLAKQAADDGGLTNATWLLGADSDVPGLRALLGETALSAVTIGQAIHWMEHEKLFAELASMLRPGGGVAVVANGTPMWKQDTAESRALRTALEQWFDTTLSSYCGTDDASRRQYAEALSAVGFDVGEAVIEYSDELDLDHVIGAVYSALPADQLPAPEQRPAFTEHISRALGPSTTFTEHVRVASLIGTIH